MNKKTRDTLTKTAVLVFGLFMVIAIAVLTFAPVQSRFVEAESGRIPLFIDKYVPETLRNDFASGLAEATSGFLAASGLLTVQPALGPVAYFAADRHYGVISANDPLVKKRLKDRPSSDFVLFRSIGSNFYANELVTRSVASQDGSYVFINLDEHWKASALHAYVHAISTANAPRALAEAFKPDAGFDPEISFSFRFVDETFALLASDLLELVQGGLSLDQAWAGFVAGSARRYADPSSDVNERQAEVIMATYDLPQKSVEFYSACNSFAAWLLERYGPDSVRAAANAFLSGAYFTLDEPFREMGGLSAALTDWKGDGAIPR